MYKILLVDDEPIILSGIKFLIDWESQSCQIVGTARNGQQALSAIEQFHPDIVICDINMPVLSGLEVLNQINESHPEIVFIMLTNYQEFDLARESMRLKAVDYLLKTQLEAENLEKSLSLAIQECSRRRKISRVNFVEDYINSNKLPLIGKNIRKIADAKNGSDLRESYRILNENGALSSYALLEFLLDFSRVPNFQTFTEQDRKRIFEFEKDVIEKLIGNFFPHYTDLQENSGCRLVVYLWDVPKEFLASIEKLRDKLNSASENVTQVKPSLLATARFAGQNQIQACCAQMQELEDRYYLSPTPFLYGQNLPPASYEPLNISSLVNRLAAEIRSKNIPECEQILEKIKSAFGTTNHKRSDAISCCVKLYSVAFSVLTTLYDAKDSECSCFENTDNILQKIQDFLTRKEYIDWLGKMEQTLTFQLEGLCTVKSDIIEKAQEYILKNIDKRILLQNVADYICISPSYLSALFKKQYNQNFVDYVNMEKMKRACELIHEGKYMICEISYMLGFENAYYFTKVFKRHIGSTPTEFQHKCRKPLQCGQTPVERKMVP